MEEPIEPNQEQKNSLHPNKSEIKNSPGEITPNDLHEGCNIQEVSKPTYTKGKRGRQRTEEQVKREIFFYRFRSGHFDINLSQDMAEYYTKHYIRKDGRSNEKYKRWQREYKQLHGTKATPSSTKRASYRKPGTNAVSGRLLTFRQKSS